MSLFKQSLPMKKGQLSELVESHEKAQAARRVAMDRKREDLKREAAVMNKYFLAATNRNISAVHKNQKELDVAVGRGRTTRNNKGIWHTSYSR